MKKFDVYKMINNQIIKKLESGTIPWKPTWNSGKVCVPKNLISKRNYSGINFWLLFSLNFQQSLFLTYNQLSSLGGKLKKEYTSIPVVFWKLIKRFDKKTDELIEIPFLRYYLVFNISDVIGIPEKLIPDNNAFIRDFNEIEAAEKLINSISDLPKIVNGKRKACYDCGNDIVYLPDAKHFFSDADYYRALFHELIHSTGHKKRLNRFDSPEDFDTKSKSYSFEELVADLGSSYLLAICNIHERIIDNNASYINEWLSKFKNDHKFFFKASTVAQKAVNYLIHKNNSPFSSANQNTRAVLQL
jgi:antirestriction protein ArdC